MSVIGVTGTDGKSSTVLLAAEMLRAHGLRVAHYSSISTHDGIVEVPNERKMTMPGRMALHRFLKQARNNGVTHAVIEVTSEGIKQNRHRLIGFSVLSLTNITPEHIESHGGFSKYRAAKLSLFKFLQKDGTVLVPEELTDEVASYARNVRTVGTNSDSVVRISDIRTTLSSTSLVLIKGDDRAEINSSLGGPFVWKNVLLAAGIVSSYEIPLATIKRAVESVRLIPGRFEIIHTRPLVIVDYAHTIAALETLLPFVKAHATGKLIHVFGAAGGGRDTYKRPRIAKLSEASADISIVTEENPFDENPDDITADIITGFTPSHTVYAISKREEAVDMALSLAGADDVVLLTAKGSETRISTGRGSFRPYNERTYIRCHFETS